MRTLPDPSESSEAFQRLPLAEQQRLRECWQRREQRLEGGVARDHALWRRTMLESAALLALIGLLSLPSGLLFAPLPLLLLPALGAMIGTAIHLRGYDRFATVLLGCLGWLALRLAVGSGLAPLTIVLGLVTAVVVFGIYGLRREMRARSGI